MVATAAQRGDVDVGTLRRTASPLCRIDANPIAAASGFAGSTAHVTFDGTDSALTGSDTYAGNWHRSATSKPTGSRPHHQTRSPRITPAGRPLAPPRRPRILSRDYRADHIAGLLPAGASFPRVRQSRDCCVAGSHVRLADRRTSCALARTRVSRPPRRRRRGSACIGRWFRPASKHRHTGTAAQRSRHKRRGQTSASPTHSTVGPETAGRLLSGLATATPRPSHPRRLSERWACGVSRPSSGEDLFRVAPGRGGDLVG